VFTLTTPVNHWEFAPTAYPGAAIPGAHGLRAGNGLTAASFINLADTGPIGFVIGGPLTGTLTAATMSANVGPVTIPFNLVGETVEAVWVGGYNATSSTSTVGQAIVVDMTGWNTATFAVNIQLSNDEWYTLTLTLTP